MTAAVLAPPRVAAVDNTASRGSSRWRRPVLWLAIVALAHGLTPLLLLGSHWGYGIDETVYLSQLNRHVPPGLFSAPRARGTTFLAAPVTLLLNSVRAVRTWLAAASALGVFVSFRPWLRLRPGWTVPLAAGLFCSIWSVMYYGFEAMPNEWVALVVLAGTGHLLLFLRSGARRDLVVFGAGMAAAALLRPSDAGFAAAGLLAGCLLGDAPLRRRAIAALVVVTGVVLGMADWVIEAYTSYGGLAARIHAAQAEQGGGGLVFSGGAEARALGGPLLCRDGCVVHVEARFWLWWVVGAVLVVSAVVFARRRLRREPVVVAVVVGLATAVQYLATVGYAAPRFLIPTYALLSLPCAYALVQVGRRLRDHRGAAWVWRGIVVAALVAQVVVQADVIRNRVAPGAAAFIRAVRADAGHLHAVGVRGPCVLLGQPSRDEALAYTTGCADHPRTAADVRRLYATGSDIVWVGPAAPPRRYRLRWRVATLPLAFGGTRTVYLCPGRRADPVGR